MTARHQIRLSSRRLGRDRSVIDALPAPTVGEMLQAARERKGVDLYRAERDTKIRLKYLAALEDGDYAELPPPVYTKGFIRNYALYLGLEPEEVIARWRDEVALQRRQERVVVTPPPQPLAAPRRGVAITPGMIVALVLGAAVLAFLGYIGWQVTRFVERPNIELSYPPNRVMEIDAETLTFVGTAGLNAQVFIEASDGRTYSTSAQGDGSWSKAVPLAKGRNDFRIIARDAITARDSEPVNVIITVPLPDVTSPPPDTPLSTPRELTLSVYSPINGATVADGVVQVRGTTSGTRITIASSYLGPPAGGPGATTAPAPTAVPGTTPPADGSPEPVPQASPPLLDITVTSGGSFDEQLTLTPGRWQLTVTAYASGLPAREEMREVSVPAGAPIGDRAMTLVIEARGGSSWMRIVADGEAVRARAWSGPILQSGSSVTISADREIFIRAGNAGFLYLTLNGRDLGRLGNRGQVANWIIEPGGEPRQTTETR